MIFRKKGELWYFYAFLLESYMANVKSYTNLLITLFLIFFTLQYEFYK